MESEITDAPGAVPLERVKGAIRFDHVTFAYSRTNTVLSDVSFDGNDIRNVTIKSLRDHIGIVFQDTILFASTVRDDIACRPADPCRGGTGHRS